MLTADQLHHAAIRKAAAGNRMAEQGELPKAKKWWRYAARQAEKAGVFGLAADLWRRAGMAPR